jgi:hypothetical protein
MKRKSLNIRRYQHLILVIVTLAAQTVKANIVINEIMQSNVDCLFTEHEFPDSWVEVYNDGETSVSLKNWRIGTSDDFNAAWRLLEDRTIAPKSYLLIYCDKEDYGLHTDFRLDPGKGSLYLFDASGTVIDNVGYKKQPAPNIAYGRVVDGGTEWAYYISATPGAQNVGTTIPDNSAILPEPMFSHTGFVSVQGQDAFTLTVSIPEDAPEDARLCITTDGSEPTETNAVIGTSWSKTISSTTVVRAKLLSDKALPIRSTTQSYIYHPEETKLSVFSLVGDSCFFYSEDEGILMGEWDDNDASKQNPNWNYNWRRPINIEYYQGEEHNLLFNQVGETRIQGGFSRRNLQKSLAVYANKRFGTKHFSGQLWHEKPAVTEVKSFILRNGGNCFENCRINDQVGQSSIGRFRSNMDWQAYEPAIYYLNGKYMGLTDLRERANEDNIEANHGYEDIDMIENWWKLDEGTFDEFYSFVDFYNRSDITFDQLKERLDIDNFLDLLVIKSFAMDTDGPSNNIVLWRPRQSDGKWRFILKDIDRMGLKWMDSEIANDYCSHVDGKIAQYKTTYPSMSRYLRIFPLFYSVLPETKELYVDRMAIYLGDFLRTENGQNLIDEYVDAINPEYLRHLQVYYDDVPDTLAYRYSGSWRWKGYLAYFRDTWWNQRLNNMFEILHNRFDLGRIIALDMERNDVPVSFNDIDLSYDEFHGKWFVDRQMRLVTDSEHAWRITTTDTICQTTVCEIYDSQLDYTPADDVSAIKIEVIDKADGLSQITADVSDIVAFRNGNEITIRGVTPLRSVKIYGADGQSYGSTCVSGATTLTMKVAPSQFYIITIIPENAPIRTIKLR